MNNVVSLEDRTKQDVIDTLKEKLKKYELEEKIEELRDEISTCMRVLTKDYFMALADEDPEVTVQLLNVILKKLEAFQVEDG